MSTYNWTVETGGTLPNSAGEYTPCQYPRTGDERDASSGLNKGGASKKELPIEAVKINTDGNTNVPRHDDSPLDYYNCGDGKDVGYGVSEAKSGDEEGMFTQ